MHPNHHWTKTINRLWLRGKRLVRVSGCVCMVCVCVCCLHVCLYPWIQTNRVEIIDDESTGTAGPVASAPQPKPRKMSVPGSLY